MRSVNAFSMLKGNFGGERVSMVIAQQVVAIRVTCTEWIVELVMDYIYVQYGIRVADRSE